MVTTRLGVLWDRTYYLREIGGHRPRQIEAGERIEVVEGGPRGRRRVLTEAEARDALRLLGVAPYPLQAGTRVNPLVRYISTLQRAERAVEAERYEEAWDLYLVMLRSAEAAGIGPDYDRDVRLGGRFISLRILGLLPPEEVGDDIVQ